MLAYHQMAASLCMTCGMHGHAGGKYTVRQALSPEQRFERIVLNRTMLQDHLCVTYKTALRRILKDLRSR